MKRYERRLLRLLIAGLDRTYGGTWRSLTPWGLKARLLSVTVESDVISEWRQGGRRVHIELEIGP